MKQQIVVLLIGCRRRALEEQRERVHKSSHSTVGFVLVDSVEQGRLAIP
jgi:hypothetical protein